MRRTMRRMILWVLCFAAAFGVTYGILLARDKKKGEEPITPEMLAAPVEETVPQTAEEAEAVPVQPASQPAVPRPENAVTVPEEYPNVPYREEAAPEGYFADAAFLGNSLVEGLSLYTSLYSPAVDQAAFYAQASMNVFHIGEYIQQAKPQHYKKIYLGLGLNEIDFVYEDIYDWYKAAIDSLRADGDEPVIYIMSLTPVSRYKSDSDSVYNKQNVESVNALLKRIADDNGCFYMDLIPVLSDADGYLPSEVTTDGVHFTPEYYQKWYDYLEHNYVLP